ncbi:hypothetical protein DFH09DRAFT_1367941 [Mycena vulgaris]|nr:hypothetical protein DFH09DRAFT_1367941 [Mycena vulgaris]
MSVLILSRLHFLFFTLPFISWLPPRCWALELGAPMPQDTLSMTVFTGGALALPWTLGASDPDLFDLVLVGVQSGATVFPGIRAEDSPLKLLVKNAPQNYFFRALDNTTGATLAESSAFEVTAGPTMMSPSMSADAGDSSAWPTTTDVLAIPASTQSQVAHTSTTASRPSMVAGDRRRRPRQHHPHPRRSCRPHLAVSRPSPARSLCAPRAHRRRCAFEGWVRRAPAAASPRPAVSLPHVAFSALGCPRCASSACARPPKIRRPAPPIANRPATRRAPHPPAALVRAANRRTSARACRSTSRCPTTASSRTISSRRRRSAPSRPRIGGPHASATRAARRQCLCLGGPRRPSAYGGSSCRSSSRPRSPRRCTRRTASRRRHQRRRRGAGRCAVPASPGRSRPNSAAPRAPTSMT